MITDLIMELGPFLAGLLCEAFNGIFGTTAPAWLLSSSSKLGLILNTVSSWDVWIPYADLSKFILGLLDCWAAIWVWKAIVKLISHVPFVGGSV